MNHLWSVFLVLLRMDPTKLFLLLANIRVSECLYENYIYSRPNETLPPDYVKDMLPPTNSDHEPIVVNISVYVIEVSAVSSLNLDFRLDIFLRMRWEDQRLILPKRVENSGYDYVILSPECLDLIWRPTPYIANAKTIQILELKERLATLILYANKTVDYKVRLYLLLGCKMEFRQYPMDVQRCPLVIETFSYDSHQVVFQWEDLPEPVVVNSEASLTQFRLNLPIETERKIVSRYFRPGNFSQLITWFVFERYLGHHVIQVYFPSFLIISMSWFSFFMGLDAVPGRVTLLVTSFLALITMFSNVKTDVPAVSYVKAVDVWMAVCLLFHFSALAEFILVKYFDYLSKQKQQRLAAPSSELAPIKSSNSTFYSSERSPQFSLEAQKRKSVSPHQFSDTTQLTAKHKSRDYWVLKIEERSKIWFPCMFCLFVILYWPLLLLRKF